MEADNKIKNIIFDWGGVLIDLDFEGCRKAFMKLGVGDLKQLLIQADDNNLFKKYELGLMSTVEFRDEVRRLSARSQGRIQKQDEGLQQESSASQIGTTDATKVQHAQEGILSDEEIDAVWLSMIKTVPEEKLQLLAELRNHYNLYLLSNTNDLHWEKASQQVFRYNNLERDDFFKQIFLSYRMHLAKPDPEIFRVALNEAGLNPEETLFIDDAEANCRAAASVGIHAAHYVPGSDLKSVLPKEPCAATIGCFDGVHRGHRYLLKQVRTAAKKRGLKSAFITFPTHPRLVLQSDYQPKLLSCLPQKTELIGKLDADYCILMPFTRELSQLSAREFMQHLRDEYNVRALIIGYDHRFGHNRSEGFLDYCHYGDELGIEVIQAKALVEDGVSISSSLIRQLIQTGSLMEANHYLGYHYFIDGTIVNGYKVGRKLGFPTANLQPSCPDKLIPGEGVYAVYAHVNGQRYRAMLNIGHRPTVNNGPNLSIEAHILDFEGDIYNEHMRIEFVSQIRKEKKFDSLERLIEQLGDDKEATITLLPL